MKDHMIFVNIRASQRRTINSVLTAFSNRIFCKFGVLRRFNRFPHLIFLTALTAPEANSRHRRASSYGVNIYNHFMELFIHPLERLQMLTNSYHSASNAGTGGAGSNSCGNIHFCIPSISSWIYAPSNSVASRSSYAGPKTVCPGGSDVSTEITSTAFAFPPLKFRLPGRVDPCFSQYPGAWQKQLSLISTCQPIMPLSLTGKKALKNSLSPGLHRLLPSGVVLQKQAGDWLIHTGQGMYSIFHKRGGNTSYLNKFKRSCLHGLTAYWTSSGDLGGSVRGISAPESVPVRPAALLKTGSIKKLPGSGWRIGSAIVQPVNYGRETEHQNRSAAAPKKVHEEIFYGANSSRLSYNRNIIIKGGAQKSSHSSLIYRFVSPLRGIVGDGATKTYSTNTGGSSKKEVRSLTQIFGQPHRFPHNTVHLQGLQHTLSETVSGSGASAHVKSGRLPCTGGQDGTEGAISTPESVPIRPFALLKTGSIKKLPSSGRRIGSAIAQLVNYGRETEQQSQSAVASRIDQTETNYVTVDRRKFFQGHYPIGGKGAQGSYISSFHRFISLSLGAGGERRATITYIPVTSSSRNITERRGAHPSGRTHIYRYNPALSRCQQNTLHTVMAGSRTMVHVRTGKAREASEQRRHLTNSPRLEFVRNSNNQTQQVEKEKRSVLENGFANDIVAISAEKNKALNRIDLNRITDHVYREIEKRIRIEMDWRHAF